MKRIKSLLMALAVLGGLWVGYLQIMPPLALPKDFAETGKTMAEADEGPDLNLMLSHVKDMASQVHHVDSPGITITHNYLKDQLARMGYAIQEDVYALSIADIQALEADRSAWHGVTWRTDEAAIRGYAEMGTRPVMNLRNIYVTVDAPDTDETILFMAHTDSVKMGPGAFDDIVSAAAMLEGLRALTRVKPVRDMVFLFTDGEEQGLLGAALFVRDHPEFQPKTRLVINLEARGNRGALIMFESTHSNLNMVRAYARTAPKPVTLSIANNVYRIMRNDTDLTRFIMAGYPGMNFAVIDGASAYHTMDDNYENFDRRSAMHYLGTATALATGFATQPDLNLTATEDGVFFPLWPGNVVIFSRTLADVLAFAAIVLYVAVLAYLVARRQAGLLRVLAVAGLSLLALALTGGIAYGLIELGGVWPALDNLARVDDGRYALIACAVLGLLVAPLFMLALRKRGGGVSAAMGVLLLPALLAPATVFLFPSASYLFSVPVLRAHQPLVPRGDNPGVGGLHYAAAVRAAGRAGAHRAGRQRGLWAGDPGGAGDGHRHGPLAHGAGRMGGVNGYQ